MNLYLKNIIIIWFLDDEKLLCTVEYEFENSSICNKRTLINSHIKFDKYINLSNLYLHLYQVVY